MFRITTSPAAYSNSTVGPAVITHRPSCSCMRRSRGSGMPSRMAATAADMPQSYQSFNKYAQTVLGKTAHHAPTGDPPPEIWGRVCPGAIRAQDDHVTVVEKTSLSPPLLRHREGASTSGRHL